MINQILHLIGIRNIDTVISEVSANFRQLFNAERVHLWMNEPLSGFFYTVDSAKKTQKCLLNRGLLANAIKSGENICSKI